MFRLLVVLCCVGAPFVLVRSMEELDYSDFSNIKSSEDENNTALSECFTEKKSFVVDTTEKVSWARSYINCIYNNMEMAIINNKEEYDLLVNTIKEKLPASEDVWTGGYYDSVAARYQWAPRFTPMTYFIWRRGRPEEANPTSLRCVKLSGSHNYTMEDVECDIVTVNYGVCQMTMWAEC